MTSTSLPGRRGCRNPYHCCQASLDTLFGRRACLGAPFFCGRRGDVRADHMRPRAGTAPAFQPPVLRACPVPPQFLVRPQLLTRMEMLSHIGSCGSSEVCKQCMADTRFPDSAPPIEMCDRTCADTAGAGGHSVRAPKAQTIHRGKEEPSSTEDWKEVRKVW